MKVRNRLVLNIAVLLLGAALVACGKGEEKRTPPPAPDPVIHKTTTPATAVPPAEGTAETPLAAPAGSGGEGKALAPEAVTPPPAASILPPNQETDLPGSPTAEKVTPAAPAPEATPTPIPVEPPKAKVPAALPESGIEPLETPESKKAEATGPRRSALPPTPGPERRSDRLKMALPKQ